MATQVTGASGIPPASTPTGALYRDVLARTGDPAVAQQAVAYAQAGLKEVYHRAMVKTGGDEAAARAAQQQYGPEVLRLAGLVPQIQAGGPGAGRDLTQALGILDGLGVDREGLNPWLNQHISDDGVLEAAGLDPAVVRAPPDTPWAHADLDAMVALARDMLERYQGPNGETLSTDQVEGYLDQARAAANRYGVGSARTTATAGAGGATTAGATQTLAALGIPIRV